MEKIYTPKGSMCAACVHNADNCSHLPFHVMPVLRDEADRKVVNCFEFERKKDQQEPGNE